MAICFDEKTKNTVIENARMRLTIDGECRAESLVLKSSGEELLGEERLPMFSVTQERPYNNEIKLIYMNKRTTYPANRVRVEGERLIVGFSLAPYEAAVSVKITDDYVAFTLDEFIVKPTDYDYLKMSTPPSCEFRLANLPIKNRENYGKWLNVMWDSKAAVAVVGTTPHARIDSESRTGYRILTADAVRGIKLRGCTAALIVSETSQLLDAIDRLEADFNMPLGVKSRRSEFIRDSIYWTDDINPENVDMHIQRMKAGGFRLALIYYPAIYERIESYLLFNEFKFRKEYPRGLETVREVISKIKAAGITPGLHFLHTHIGMKTHYVTPHADRRLNTTRKFTLSRPLGMSDTEIYVDEDPTDTVMHPDCRILKFGTELISYEGYETEPPYRFVGCKRGANDTEIFPHPEAEVGGVLDISEFSAKSVYLNQNSDLQDEIADKIAELYATGFEFAYFDGSEGTNPPFEFHIPNAQYRVYKKLNTPPIFCEGAAKAHFGWHMLSGANAFDVFPTDIFKEMIDKFPVVAAKEMQKDFTRVNFGWWNMFNDMRPDVFEYGMMRAVAWDCPMTVMMRKDMDGVSLLLDNLNAISKWEKARRSGFFTEDVKAMLRDSRDEYTLISEKPGEYALERIEKVALPIEKLYAYVFARGGYSYASLCYVGEGVKIKIPLSDKNAEYLDGAAFDKLPIEFDSGAVISVSRLAYLKTSLSQEKLKVALSLSERFA